MFNTDGSAKTCKWCRSRIFSGDSCGRCASAEATARRAWSEKELTPELVEKVRVQLIENNDLGWEGWSPPKKLKYDILRSTKDMLRNRFEGKRVAWKHGHHEGEGVVESVKIHHGQLFYHLEGRSKGLKRGKLDSLEVVDDAPGT